MNKAYISIFIVGTMFFACRAPMATVGEEGMRQEEWEGEYWYGGIGYSAQVDLLPEGQCKIYYGTCNALESERIQGQWTESSTSIFLEAAPTREDLAWFVGEMRKVRIGEDSFLLPKESEEESERTMAKMIEVSFIKGGFSRQLEIKSRLVYESMIEAGISHKEMMKEGFVEPAR